MILPPSLLQHRTRAIINWDDAAIIGPSGNETGLPQLTIERWQKDRIGIALPSPARVECRQHGEHDYEFTLSTTRKLRLHRELSVWMPEGPPYVPEFGALQADFICEAKPQTNVFPMRLTLPPGSLMWYEGELSELERDGCEAFGPCYRPPWCVGSYALYVVDRWNGSAAVNLRRLGDFPRPFAYELNNLANWTWGEWLWDAASRILTKVIPQAWLNKAKAPIVVDDTFGKTDVGGSTAAVTNDYMGASGPYSPANDGTLDSVLWYPAADESSTPVTLGVHADSGGSPSGQARVDQSAGGTGTNTPTWTELAMVGGNNVLAANQYHPSKNHDTQAWTIAYDGTDGSVRWFYKWSAYSAGNLDNPFPAGPASWNWAVSMYAKYTPTAAGGPSPHYSRRKLQGGMIGLGCGIG